MQALNSLSNNENLAALLTLQGILTSSTNLNSVILLYKETLHPLIQACSKILTQINNNFSILAQKILEVQSKTNLSTIIVSNVQELNTEILLILYK